MGRSYTFFLLILALTAVFFSSFSFAAEQGAEVASEHDNVDDEGEDLTVTEEEEEEDEGEDTYDDEDDFDQAVIPSPDIVASAIFPEYSDKVLEIGEETTLLVVLSNTGDNTFNMTEMGAYLQSHYDLTYYIQNYSTVQPDVILEAGEQVTLSYKFQPHERLEPETFHFSAYVQYNDTADDTVYRTTYFNSSIVLVDAPTAFDVQGALMYVGAIVAVLFAVLYFKKPSTSSSMYVERGTKQSGDDAGWGQAYVPRGNKKISSKKN